MRKANVISHERMLSAYLTVKAEKEVDVDKNEKFIILKRTHSKVSSGRQFLYITPWDKTIKPLAGIKIVKRLAYVSTFNIFLILLVV